MLNLKIVKHNNIDVMSSVDLAEMCIGKDKFDHKNFMAKAKRVLGEGIVNFYYRENYNNNNERNILMLPEREANIMIESYSKNKARVYGEMEHGALCAIEQILGIELQRHYKIGKYRVDGYCKESNTCYEIDEPQHYIGGELSHKCKEREAHITRELNCTFKRIKV